ncbi:MAG: hypothetical protein HC896_12065 [Bacteroidales bacterium]|nr:hypothetical protein [Bacteroidales bacterium]
MNDDESILSQFVQASLPGYLVEYLRQIIMKTTGALAVRSSSKLEDSYVQPFAGVYATYMIAVDSNYAEKSADQMNMAIKCVYASIFMKAGKSYIAAASNATEEEKMGIVIQDVCGQQYGKYFFPAISGIARSINYYPVAGEKPQQGIAQIAIGLGKHIVEGGTSLRFSPAHPHKAMQLASIEDTLRTTQKSFLALHLNLNQFSPSVNDSINLAQLQVKDFLEHANLKLLTSAYDYQNQVLRDDFYAPGRRLVTFNNILIHKKFPLADILVELLDIGKQELNSPVEIEFALDIDKDFQHATFSLLQIRPIVDTGAGGLANLQKIDPQNMLVHTNKAPGKRANKRHRAHSVHKTRPLQPRKTCTVCYGTGRNK